MATAAQAPIKLTDLLKAPTPGFGGINTNVGGATTPATIFNGTAAPSTPAVSPYIPASNAAPVAAPAPAPVATAPVAAPAATPVFQGSAPATPAAPAAASPAVNPAYLNADGSFKAASQIASDVGSALKAAHGNADVGTLAAQQFGAGTAVDPTVQARQITNARNDIATGNTDPYKIASQSGIAYTPQELNAIESAYAGIYDPALDTAMAKVTAKQTADAAAASQAADLEKIKAQTAATEDEQANAPYTLGANDVRYDGNGNAIAVGSGASGASGAAYVPGSNPTVDAYVSYVKGGGNLTTVPDQYKDAVAQGLAQAATSTALSPTSTTAIGIINQLQALPNLDALSGTGIVGSIEHPSSLFPGTAVQQTQNLAKQLQATISLANRQQLKGQGAISDFEFKVLGDAATDLGLDANGRTNLSPTDFKQQLNNLELKLQVGPTNLTDDEIQYLASPAGGGYTPDQIRQYSQSQSSTFNSVGNTTASTNPTGKNIPQKNNNPGDIKAGSMADALAVGKDQYGHLIFPDAATGFKALTGDLTAKINGATKRLPDNPTIAQLGAVYAQDPNWPKKVASILGVTVDTPTKSVPLAKLVQAVATQEGFYA